MLTGEQLKQLLDKHYGYGCQSALQRALNAASYPVSQRQVNRWITLNKRIPVEAEALIADILASWKHAGSWKKS